MATTDSVQIHGLIGESTKIKEVCSILKKIAPYDASVLIEGESGTGKELVARAIHFGSPRKDKEFVIVNCSAFSDSLLESELFGHRRGSFTGAIAEKKGLFEIADQGTFIFDEVGDMSAALQVKLLRVLQEGVFLKVGGTTPISVDLRIIAATNQDLKVLVLKGKFREDLFYRLNVIHLTLPPLRDRLEDMPLLVIHIIKRLAERNKQPLKKVSKDALRLMQEYRWPGNVRELENELERAFILSEGNVIEPNHFSPHLRETNQRTRLNKKFKAPANTSSLKDHKRIVVAEFEKDLIHRVLEQTEGNRTKAAKELCISRQELIRKLKLYQMT
ncbi:MAG: sigma-54-dependent Fis family transcriptional regulator [Candidatus Omnitrophica bacterium]|nr:sigma-54-dependent Fis family transcriptional regulator [Candidatus Omnitrophota bacterium]